MKIEFATKLDRPNKNGYIMPMDVFKKTFEEYSDKLKHRLMFGTIGLKLNTSHVNDIDFVINKIYIDEDKVSADITFLKHVDIDPEILQTKLLACIFGNANIHNYIITSADIIGVCLCDKEDVEYPPIDLKDPEFAIQPMISLEEFEEIIELMKQQEDKDTKFSEFMETYLDGNFVPMMSESSHYANMKLLSYIFNDRDSGLYEGTWMDWFVYENDFGRNSFPACIDEVEYVISNAKDMYEFLILWMNIPKE